MEENKDKKSLSGKLQLKKTYSAGQIKQNFSHGRSKSVSVEVKRKRTFTSIEKKTETDDKIKSDVQSFEKDEQIKPDFELPKSSKEGIKDLNIKRQPKKPIAETKQVLNENQQDVDSTEKTRPQKFPKSPKSFENRRQGKLTISQALDDDNEKVRSLAAIKRAREKAKQRKVDQPETKESFDSKEKKKKRNYYSRFYISK